MSPTNRWANVSAVNRGQLSSLHLDQANDCCKILAHSRRKIRHYRWYGSRYRGEEADKKKQRLGKRKGNVSKKKSKTFYTSFWRKLLVQGTETQPDSNGWAAYQYITLYVNACGGLLTRPGGGQSILPPVNAAALSRVFHKAFHKRRFSRHGSRSNIAARKRTGPESSPPNSRSWTVAIPVRDTPLFCCSYQGLTFEGRRRRNDVVLSRQRIDVTCEWRR